jgi:hypothetical protein
MAFWLRIEIQKIQDKQGEDILAEEQQLSLTSDINHSGIRRLRPLRIDLEENVAD